MAPATTADPVAAAADLLLAARDDSDASGPRRELAQVDPATLHDRLESDDATVAFWVNVYNAATQHALRQDPSRYEDRRGFFGEDLITVAGRSLSLDDIEHGILRRGYPKWTLGYVRWPFRSEYAELLSPSERDPRIHFALNCGAASCPIVRPYSRDDVGDALETATRDYLESTVSYDAEAGRVTVPRVFLWFRGDFGGKRGILEFLHRYDQIPADARPRLRHRDWDWSLDPADFA